MYFGGGGLLIVLGIIALVLGYTLIGIILNDKDGFGHGAISSRARVGSPKRKSLESESH